ncbi:hypothetical protein ACFQ7J_17700 [Streptomyces sp. NPDC056501]|uniref:hypothetical protein n=1 Tax=Streptomyces sp. NPDC056501 TaxID=3345841 RepID=UPI0036BD8E4C
MRGSVATDSPAPSVPRASASTPSTPRTPPTSAGRTPGTPSAAGVLAFGATQRYEDGREATRIFDVEPDLGSGLTGALLPGRKAVAAYGFDVPPGKGAA